MTKWLYLNMNFSPKVLLKLAWGKHAPLTKEKHKAYQSAFRSGLWARGLVIAERHRPHSETVEELQAIKRQLQNLATAIEKLRINQSRSLYLVLTHIGKMDPKKANEIATSNLLD